LSSPEWAHLMASTHRLADIRIADTFARGVVTKRWITSTLSLGRIDPPAVLEPCVLMLIAPRGCRREESRRETRNVDL
jgi:hypothetical protein